MAITEPVDEAPTIEVRTVALPDTAVPASPPPCAGCGGTTYDADGRCPSCGAYPPPPDRFEADLDGVCVLTDRGIAHEFNEDSVSAAVLGDRGLRVLVVSDGVSSSTNPQAASGAAARAGLEATVSDLLEGRPAAEAIMSGVAGATAAVRAAGADAGANAPSCTYVAAVVRDVAGGAEVTTVGVGDSRVYWLAAPGAADAAQTLTVDDSWAQALVDAGAMDAEAAMRDPRAHTLLRWLGADGPEQPWSERCLRSYSVRGPGMVLVCSDGLWNYLPEAADLAERALGSTAVEGGRMLAGYALQRGGSDNITAALAPISGAP